MEQLWSSFQSLPESFQHDWIPGVCSSNLLINVPCIGIFPSLSQFLTTLRCFLGSIPNLPNKPLTLKAVELTEIKEESWMLHFSYFFVFTCTMCQQDKDLELVNLINHPFSKISYLEKMEVLGKTWKHLEKKHLHERLKFPKLHKVICNYHFKICRCK